MTIDFHYHVAADTLFGTKLPRGCIVAQKEADNAACLGIAARHGVATALFAHPRGSDWTRVLRLVADGKAIAYQHLELFDEEDLTLIDPMLLASQDRGLPVILHLSRHDLEAFAEARAMRCLERVLERFPKLPVVVSHCGGENAVSVIRTARACPRIMLDTSRLAETSARSGHSDVTSLLDRIAAEVSPKQVLYGSDQCWPRYDGDFEDLDLLSSAFRGQELEDIRSGNAIAILATLDGPKTSGIAHAR